MRPAVISKGQPHAITRIHGRAAILIAAVLAAGLLAWSADVHQQIIRAIALAEPVMARHPVWGALLFVGLAALSAMLAFFSSVLLVPVGVHVWGEVGCFLLLWSGWFLGGIATYSIGRHLGQPVVRRILSARAVARYEGRIPRAGSFLTVLLVQLALPSDIAGYFFGLLGYPAHIYVGALTLAELPYALGAVLLGAAFIQRQYLLLLLVAGVALAALAWGWLRRRRRRSGPPPAGGAP